MIKYVATAVAGIVVGIGVSSFLDLPNNSEEKILVAEEAVPLVEEGEAGESQAPAYMIVLGEVYDREAFGAGYVAKLPPLYEKFGGHYIGIGGGVEVLEGDFSPPSFVIGKWPSMDAARAFWNSPEYEELKRARIDGGWSEFDVLLVEGLAEK